MSVGPSQVAGIAKGVGGLVDGLFGKSKTKIKRKPKTAAIGAALDVDQKNLKGDMAQLREAGQAAYGNVAPQAAQLPDMYRAGLSTFDQFSPEGRQFRRSDQAITSYGNALRAANQDAMDAVGRRFNQQQALMGAGGGMSPFLQMAYANQLAQMNRGVAAQEGGMKLDNMRRFQDIGLSMPERRFGLFGRLGSASLIPMGMLTAQNQAGNARLMGALNAENAGTNTIVEKKDNFARKFARGLGAGADAVQGMQNQGYRRALTNAYLEDSGYEPIQDSWRNLFKGPELVKTKPDQ